MIVALRTWGWGGVVLGTASVASMVALVVGAADVTKAQWLFVHTTYYLMMVTVACWVGTYLHGVKGLRLGNVTGWARENWPGLAVAALVTATVALAVEPALRILSDEANLVGTSKNLFASKTATFTVSGKNYYDSYWDVDVAIDRRPTLFPFLVSLVHTALGYSYDNAFLVNLLLLPGFLLVAYRLAKSLGGETFGVAAALFVASHPITLLSARSGGFDFLAAFFGLLVVKSVLDYARDASPAKLAVLWMNTCLLTEIRYESALFVLPVAAFLVLHRKPSLSALRPYAFIYALTPVFVAPRAWQAVLRGNVPEQDPGTVTFSVQNFFANAYEYFQPVLEPRHSYPAHNALLIALGAVGCAMWVRWVSRHVRAREWGNVELRFAAFVCAWMLLQAVIVFSYVWGRAQFPSAARLVLAIDTFFSFAAAWAVARMLVRWRPFVAVLVAGAVFAMQLPVASQHRMLNRLTQTRESASTWRFFERLSDPRVLIVTDRPNHFTIMSYGAMSFDSARRDPHLLTALARRLFQDVYVIQRVRLSTGAVLPGYEIWPERQREVLLEFQNDADELVRISRLVH